jgi:hypothetical protein
MATTPTIYFNEARFELLKLSRNRSYLFSMIGFPVIFYLLFGVTNKNAVFHGHTIARYLLAGYSCFGAMGSALFGIGAGLAFERGHGWLEMKRASPMPAAAYLLAKLCVSITFGVGITLLLMTLGTALAGVEISALEGLKLLAVIAGGVIPFRQPRIGHWPVDAVECCAGCDQPGLPAALVLRRFVDADRDVAALAAGGRAWFAFVLVLPSRAADFRLQQ